MFDQNGDMTNKGVSFVWAIFYVPTVLFLIVCLLGAYNDGTISGIQFFVGVGVVVGYAGYRLILLLIEMFFFRKLISNKLAKWINR